MPRVDLADLSARARQLLHGFTRGQKAMLLVAVAAAGLGAFAFLGWASAPSWTPLYSGLPAEQAAGVTEELDAMGVQYKLEGSDTILVPREQVYQARLDLSAQGLPEDGNPGYDLLDDHGITTSEFKQRVDYQRALEGELVRTIEAIDGVERAEVHLVLPEHDLFSDDTVRPTASVLVHTSGDRSLSGEQVRAVVHLVASSVEGLQTDDVAVADQTGRVLAAPGEDGGAAVAGTVRADQTTAFEADLSRSLEALLVPMTGTGRSRVSVTAVLDLDERNTTSETFSEPGAAPVVTETTNEETYTGAGNGVGGVLGPDAVVDGGTTGAPTDYSRNEANRTYAVDKVTEQVRSAPGDVTRLSVAVLVDEATEADLADIETLVAAAAGIDPARGDQLAVTAAAFDSSSLPAPATAEEADAAASPLLPLARVVAIVLIVVLVLALAYRSARRSAVVRHPLAIPLAAGSVRDLDGAAPELAGPPDLALGPSEEDRRQLDLQSQIGDLIDRQPDEVAQVLRGWLAERRS